jgi:cytosine/creatinine deaminase
VGPTIATLPSRTPQSFWLEGAVADLVVPDACDAREPSARRTPRRWVIGKGRLIAESRAEKRRYFDLALKRGK